MKKLLIMKHITLTCVLGGVLYAGYMHHERAEEISVVQEYRNPYQGTMPNIVFDSMTQIPF